MSRSLPHRALLRRTAAPVGSAVLALSLLAACGDDEPSADAEDPSTTPSVTESSTSTPPETGTTTTPESSTTEDLPATEEVAVFFIGDTPQGPRLFRELHQVESDNPTEEALALLAGDAALDPDYLSLVPAEAFSAVEVSPEAEPTYLVTLADPTLAEVPDGMTKKAARYAVQQVLYTLQAASGTEQPTYVQFQLDGQPSTFLGQQANARTADPLTTLGPVNVLTPSEGASVAAGDPLVVEGLANSFEATVPWQVLDADGKTVVDDFSNAEGWADRLYPFTAEVDTSDLAPGTYTFVAMTDDPSGGEGGGPTEDSKTFVVE